MKVRELAALFTQYPPDAEVVTTWEGTAHLVRVEDVYLSVDGVLIINADDGWEKEHHQKKGIRSDLERAYEIERMKEGELEDAIDLSLDIRSEDS